MIVEGRILAERVLGSQPRWLRHGSLWLVYLAKSTPRTRNVRFATNPCIDGHERANQPDVALGRRQLLVDAPHDEVRTWSTAPLPEAFIATHRRQALAAPIVSEAGYCRCRSYRTTSDRRIGQDIGTPPRHCRCWQMCCLRPSPKCFRGTTENIGFRQAHC